MATKPTTRRQKLAATPPAQRADRPSPSAEPIALSGKLGAMAMLLRRAQGASLAQLVEATGWKAASVRGAMAGALKARGLTIVSEKAQGGVRTYRVRQPLRVEVSA